MGGVFPYAVRDTGAPGRSAVLGGGPSQASPPRGPAGRSAFAARRPVVVAGWLMHGEAMPEDEVARYVPDLKRDRFHCFVERWHFVPMLILIGALWVWGVRTGGARLAASLITWGVFLRTTIALHGTWLVNSASHGWGTRRFATPDDSTNNWWVALLTFGEGWHNNHHYDPRSVRHGIVWYELDVNWLCITVLSWVGLAKNVRLPKRT